MPSSWLPPEVGGACQPYSMLPLLRRTGHDLRYASPCLGTLVAIDRSELAIRMVFIAPSNVQRMAQAAGVRQMVMIRPKGIELVEQGVREVDGLTLSTQLADIIEGLDS